jgi:hypothetical protein
MPALDRHIAGRIAYRSGTGAEVGRERFDIVHHAGGIVMRALCEMDEFDLLRDTTTAFDTHWRPRDAFLRIITKGETACALRFAIGDDRVQMEGLVAGKGQVSEEHALSAPLAYLGLHPLQGDALIVEVRGTDRPGEFVAIEAITNSNSPNGDEQIALTPVTIHASFVGYEDITVAAGTFAARRYALRWHKDWPPADLWVRRDDCLFLQMRWSMIDTWYELTHLEE